jgi:hypothetical protein
MLFFNYFVVFYDNIENTFPTINEAKSFCRKNKIDEKEILHYHYDA